MFLSSTVHLCNVDEYYIHVIELWELDKTMYEEYIKQCWQCNYLMNIDYSYYKLQVYSKS